MKRVLVVEDESAIREFEVINLNRGGYEAVEAEDGEQALKIFEEQKGNFDIALLDITMPNMDGFTLCKELRKRSSTVGIIMLTAKTQEMDKVSGLMLGADDYITKPFSPTELMARVDVLYRRVEMQNEKLKHLGSEINLGEFSLNLHRRALLKNGEFIELTQVEFGIMEYLFRNPDSPLDRKDILDHVWDTHENIEEKIVDVNVRRLRMKVEDNPSQPKHLITVWGVGYKWAT